jgi:hypothetical protein
VSADGRVLASVGADRCLRLANLQRGLPGDVIEHGSPCVAVALGASVAAVATGREALLYNTLDGRRTTRARCPGAVTAIALSSDRLWIAVGDERGNLRLFRAATGRRGPKVTLPGAVRSVAFDLSGAELCVVHGTQLSWLSAADLSALMSLDATREQIAPVWLTRGRRVAGETARTSGWWWCDAHHALHRPLGGEVTEMALPAPWRGCDRLLADAGGQHVVPMLRGAPRVRECSAEMASAGSAWAVHPTGELVVVGDEAGAVRWRRVSDWAVHLSGAGVRPT